MPTFAALKKYVAENSEELERIKGALRFWAIAMSEAKDEQQLVSIMVGLLPTLAHDDQVRIIQEAKKEPRYYPEPLVDMLIKAASQGVRDELVARWYFEALAEEVKDREKK